MMKAHFYSVSLAADELLLLDGKVRPEVQAKVDEVKEAKALEALVADAAEARFIANALREARTNGRLICRQESLRYCDYTGKSAGYATHSRNGKYYRKGEANYKKPLFMRGVELADRFVICQGSATLGCCMEFWDKVRPKLATLLEDVKAEISEKITGHPPRWQRFNRYRCDRCGWVGHEGQLLKLPAVFGGHYSGECPSCHAQNRPLLPHVVQIIEGFEVVPTKRDGNAPA
jgi:hypothetical protein